MCRLCYGRFKFLSNLSTATIDDVVKYLSAMIKIYIILAIIQIVNCAFQAENGFSPTPPNIIPILEIIFYLINVVSLFDIALRPSLINTIPPLFSLPAIIILNILNLAYHNQSGASKGTLVVSLIVSIFSLFVSGSNTYVVYYLRGMLKRGDRPQTVTDSHGPSAPAVETIKNQPEV